MSEPARPEIAVVVPTRRRETRLAFLLDALAEGTLDRERFEVLVVRDGDPPGPKATAPDGLAVRFVSAPEGRMPAEARNHGWRASRAPFVAFTDDDCRPAPDWLERLLDAREGDDVFLQGRTEPDPDELNLNSPLARTQRITGPSGWFETCNMAYPRSLLERLGGFDEAYRGVGGEDTDLGLRAEAAGGRAKYVHEAVVWHAVLPRTFPQALREASRGGTVPLLVGMHPEQRREMYLRGFWKESHALLPLAAAGAAVLRRRPAIGLAAIAPCVRLYLRGYPGNPRSLARGLVDMPARAAVDAVEIAATAAAAARLRVAVL